MISRCLTFALLPCVLICCGCAGGPFARSGTVGGGLTGGAIGALAGAPGNRSLEGAAIGAVAGSVIGNAVGDAADRDVAVANAQRDAYIHQAQSQAVTPDQAMQMAQSGVNDQLIVNQLRANGVARPLSTNDVIALKQGGVSDQVIAAWQQTPVAGSVPRTARAHPIVIEPVCDGYHCPPRYRRGGGHYWY